MLIIRPAKPDDLSAITDIYNEAILTTDATFDTETKTIENQKEWFESHNSRNPIMVSELDDQIIGWASLSKWSDRCAYSDTAEISVYIKDGYRGKGIGRQLIEKIIQAGKEVGLHTIISRITAGNDESIYLHEEFGFEHIGVMKEVGYKSGRLLDVVMMQKIYTDKSWVKGVSLNNGNTVEPGYLALYTSGELKKRVESLESRLSSCDICPRNCGVNRLVA